MGGETAWLAGVRVLDLSRNLPGPAASWLLGGMGASVDRVEPPGVGDPTRLIPPFVDGIGAFFGALSAGKRSIACDLRSAEGAALIRRVVGRYDVLIDGFKPGVLEAAGLGPDALFAEHPRLVIARISGFGQDGPWADRPGHDVNYLGVAGVLAGAAEATRGLALSTVQIADQSAAMMAVSGVAAALFHRERVGRGSVVDVSLTEAALAMLAPHVAVATARGSGPVAEQEILTGLLPGYGTYRCADGRWITVGALEPKFAAELVRVIPEAATGDRSAIAAVIAKRPSDAWIAALAGACVGPVLEPSELADHPQHAARRAVATIGGRAYVVPPLGPRVTPGPVPALGQHTAEILGEAGLHADEIAGLRARRVIA
jgi:alpha-methylacyl-CoA racemase